MKINLTDLIKTGDISPFKWGDSEDDILRAFPEWQNRIKELKNSQCPYLELDSIELYFEKDFYKGLSEIVIKLWNFDVKYESEFFEIGWLRSEIKFPEVFEILNNHRWQFELTKGPKFETPIILPNRNVFFAFEPLFDKSEDKTELQKIYDRRDAYDSTFLNGGNEKVRIYNGKPKA